MNVYVPRTLTLFDTNASWAHLLFVVRCTMVLFEGVAHFPRRRVGLCSNSLADGVQGMALIGDRIPMIWLLSFVTVVLFKPRRILLASQSHLSFDHIYLQYLDHQTAKHLVLCPRLQPSENWCTSVRADLEVTKRI